MPPGSTARRSRKLGSPNYYELYKGFGFALDELAAQCRALLDETERMWEEAGDRLFRERLGIGLAEARPARRRRGSFARPSSTCDLPRASECFPRSRRRSPTSGSTSAPSANVHLDLDSRPGKSPRAFCSPIEVPGKVMLVIQPIGGHDDWRALFHEAGHTEHYANTSADLPMEAKRLGDMAVTEGWAALLEHLVDEPAWLNRRLDVPKVRRRSRTPAATSMLYFVRRYSAKLLYEIEFFQAADPVDDAAALRRAADATRSSSPPTRRAILDDIDGSST